MNRIEIELKEYFDTNSPSSVLNSEVLKKVYAFDYLISLPDLMEFLNLSRSAFERQLFKESEIRHFAIKDRKTAGLKYKVYIDVSDIMHFLCNEGELIFTKNMVEDNDVTQKVFTDISQDDKEYLVTQLLDNNWLSASKMQVYLERSRSVVSRLNGLMDTVSFKLPGSQTRLKRYIVHHDKEYYLSLLKNYSKISK
ncbi:hypothetical protein V1503_24115 [Bacillus sp. SCS-151]|uniref:hypothetical protein n=1 Tax=Nanhaiella sioensis TaxID=3115293 RepID=UPI0039785886